MSDADVVTRVAVYARERANRSGWRTWRYQRDACHRFAAGHTDWLVDRVTYADVGFHGRDDDRPALERLLFDVGAGRVDVVLVHQRRDLAIYKRLFEDLEQRLAAHAVQLIVVDPRGVDGEAAPQIEESAT